MQRHPVALVEFGEVVSLQAHVVEFEEGEFLLPGQSQLDRIHGQHSVDREIAPDVAEKIDVVELGEPVRVVGHDRVVLAVAKADETRERLSDPCFVGLDCFRGEQLATFVLARRVADHRRAAAHQRDWLGPRFLQPMQHHDLHERADVQRRGGAIEADVSDERSGAGLVVQTGEIRALMDEPARLHHAQKIGFRFERVSQTRVPAIIVARALGKREAKRNRNPVDDLCIVGSRKRSQPVEQ